MPGFVNRPRSCADRAARSRPAYLRSSRYVKRRRWLPYAAVLRGHPSDRPRTIRAVLHAGSRPPREGLGPDEPWGQVLGPRGSLDQVAAGTQLVPAGFALLRRVRHRRRPRPHRGAGRERSHGVSQTPEGRSRPGCRALGRARPVRDRLRERPRWSLDRDRKPDSPKQGSRPASDPRGALPIHKIASGLTSSRAGSSPGPNAPPMAADSPRSSVGSLATQEISLTDPSTSVGSASRSLTSSNLHERGSSPLTLIGPDPGGPAAPAPGNVAPKGPAGPDARVITSGNPRPAPVGEGLDATSVVRLPDARGSFLGWLTDQGSVRALIPSGRRGASMAIFSATPLEVHVPGDRCGSARVEGPDGGPLCPAGKEE